MADIKIRDKSRISIRTVDRAELMAGRFRDAMVRTRDGMYEHNDQKDDDAATYTGELSENMAASVYVAARGAAIRSAHRKRIMEGMEREEIYVADIYSGIPAADTGFPNDGHVTGYTENCYFPAGNIEGPLKDHSIDRPGQVNHMRGSYGSHSPPEVNIWTAGSGRVTSERSVIYAGNDAGEKSMVLRGAGSMGTVRERSLYDKRPGLIAGQHAAGEPWQERMKEYTIAKLRRDPLRRNKPFPGLISNMHGKGRSPAVTGRLLRRIAEDIRVMSTALTSAGAAALAIIMITVIFSAAFSVTGDESGNDFAYDIYGVSPGDTAIVEVAREQLGNTGGKKFWKWYGFKSHVHWCACFVSWCADQCGYIEEDMMPRFAVVGNGADWFRSKHRWASRGYTPKPGDIIFFDFGRDGELDHVGIVESCDGKTVTTIEGNSDDKCRRQTYTKGAACIAGYGVPVFGIPVINGDACAWAAKIAADNSYHYVNWESGDSRTHECPVCHEHPEGEYRGWNCIGFAFACWKHGAGIKCRCSCSAVNNGEWERLLNSSSDAEANKLATRIVGVPCTVIRNGGKAIPLSKLKKGDIVSLFNGSTYWHTIFYEGDGKYADCTSSRSDSIRSGTEMSGSFRSRAKVAIRYIG